MDSSMTKIGYQVQDVRGEIYWAASEYFGELEGRRFALGGMEAAEIAKNTELSETGKILLSAVAGAVIQHLLDSGIKAEKIFSEGEMRIV